MLKDAIKGKYDGYLLEGMACPGGCVAGAGTLQAINKTAAMVKAYAKKSAQRNAPDNAYIDWIPELERMDGPVDAVAESSEALKPQGDAE